MRPTRSPPAGSCRARAWPRMERGDVATRPHAARPGRGSRARATSTPAGSWPRCCGRTAPPQEARRPHEGGGAARSAARADAWFAPARCCWASGSRRSAPGAGRGGDRARRRRWPAPGRCAGRVLPPARRARPGAGRYAPGAALQSARARRAAGSRRTAVPTRPAAAVPHDAAKPARRRTRRARSRGARCGSKGWPIGAWTGPDDAVGAPVRGQHARRRRAGAALPARPRTARRRATRRAPRRRPARPADAGHEASRTLLAQLQAAGATAGHDPPLRRLTPPSRCYAGSNRYNRHHCGAVDDGPSAAVEPAKL